MVEQTSKFATFWAGYIGTPMVVQKLMYQKQKNKLVEALAGEAMPKTYTEIREKVTKGLMDERLGKGLIHFKNKGWMTLTGMNLLIAGVLPLVFNIGFSKWRYQRNLAAQPRPQFNHPGGMLVQKPAFDQWMQPRRFG